jgi:hypothetical protein
MNLKFFVSCWKSTKNVGCTKTSLPGKAMSSVLLVVEVLELSHSFLYNHRKSAWISKREWPDTRSENIDIHFWKVSRRCIGLKNLFKVKEV